LALQKRHAINDAASQLSAADAPADGGSTAGRRSASASKRRKVSVVEEPLRL